MNKYTFGPDAFRDNETERHKLIDAIERIAGGDEVEDLTRDELERLVNAARASGSNRAAIDFAKDAQDYMDNEDERLGTQQLERDFTNYWEGNETIADRDRQDLRDSGRGYGTY